VLQESREVIECMCLRPLFKRQRPFMSTGQIINFSAGLDNAAVDPTGNHGRNFTGRYCNHRLVQQCDTARNVTLPDQSAALTLERKSYQVLVGEALTDRGGLGECLVRLRGIAFVDGAVTGRQQQVALVPYDSPLLDPWQCTFSSTCRW